jgi:hypothetical protein
MTKKTLVSETAEQMLDRVIAQEELLQSKGRLEILTALAPLDHQSRKRVLAVATHLVEADNLIEGVIESFLAKVKK